LKRRLQDVRRQENHAAAAASCPEIERFSIGWRMGYGEDYMMKRDNWYLALSDEESSAYRELFPEPPTWKGFWNDDDE